MDKSVDSIGSCSLDVDADSSEKSDTSGSLNFPTPISIKDITRDFVANINERCAVRKIETTVTLMNSSSSHTAQTILTQPTCELAPPQPASSSSALQSIATEVGNDKKPSYLNLACCVNGYSNITTYDSKIRQDINKSREVSPIRPSTSSIQYCKKNDFLAPPKLQKMPNTNPIEMEQKATSNGHSHGLGDHIVPDVAGNIDGKNTSFIQQQMERLYGPAALAQGFYSPKKVRTSTAKQRVDNSGGPTSELKLKFKELSPSKDYSEFRRKINGTGSQPVRSTIEANPDNNNIDLPVLRHLSQEFRAQLPKISPKRNVLRTPPSEDETASANNKHIHATDKQTLDEVDHKKNIATDIVVGADTNLIAAICSLSVTNKCTESSQDISKIAENHVNNKAEFHNRNEKDGHHFIKILKAEEVRLLSLASNAEKYIDELSNQPEVGEEVFGLLRSAAGKARLLVSQKMKQFEGLCHKNINYTPDEVCRTTSDDLQGFWDMVYLQVDDINAIFVEVEKFKANNWKLEKTEKPKKQTKTTKTNISSAANGSPKSQKPKSAAALERESQRKQKLLEMKRQKKLELAAASNRGKSGSKENASNIVGVTTESPVEILINENSS